MNIFSFDLKPKRDLVVACCMDEKNYSLTAIKDNKKVLFCEYKSFEDEKVNMLSALSADVKRFGLLGEHCRLILSPSQYQLLLMDALNVPEQDMAKALKWKLKGLVNYPLKDIAMDVFTVPPHGAVGQRKKVFVAATSLSAIKQKLDLFEAAYLKLESIGIAELALKNVFTLIPQTFDSPSILISLQTESSKLLVLFNGQLFLERELALTIAQANENNASAQAVLLEIQRSIDFCLSELKLGEPKQIIFTPSAIKSTDFLKFLQETLTQNVAYIHLDQYLEIDSKLDISTHESCIYGIGGALNINAEEEVNESID